MTASRIGSVALGVVIGAFVIAGTLFLLADWGAHKFETATLISPPILFVPK